MQILDLKTPWVRTKTTFASSLKPSNQDASFADVQSQALTLGDLGDTKLVYDSWVA